MARQVYAGLHRDGLQRGFWVYIMASGRNGTIYVGQTDDLGRRVHQHRHETLPRWECRLAFGNTAQAEARPMNPLHLLNP